MTLRLGTINLHWPNNAGEKRRDVEEAEPHADVLFFQEVYRTPIGKFLGSQWDTLDSNAVGKRDIAMAWRDDVITVINSDFYQIGKMKKGSKKTFAIAWIETEDTIYGSLHPPHGKYERENPGIKAECARGVIEFVNVQTKPVILGGDWNFQIDEDLHGIAQATGGSWAFAKNRGIDGFLVHPDFVISDQHEIDIISDHPVVFITVTKKLTEKPVPPVLTRGPQFDAIDRALRTALKNNRDKPARLKIVRAMRKLLRQIPATPVA